MKCIGGIWLPDNEVHLVEWMQKVNALIDGKLTYQWSKQKAAMRYIKQWRTAIDAGAHVGLWSMHMTKKFDCIYAFEPCPDHIECFSKNVAIPMDQTRKVLLYPVALGAVTGFAQLSFESGSSGGTHIDPKGVTEYGGDNLISVQTLDSFGAEDVDFLKIDVEGYELQVVQGGEKTIRTNEPAIIIEQKPKGLAERYGTERMAAVELLESWGAKIRADMSGDYILTWGK